MKSFKIFLSFIMAFSSLSTYASNDLLLEPHPHILEISEALYQKKITMLEAQEKLNSIKPSYTFNETDKELIQSYIDSDFFKDSQEKPQISEFQKDLNTDVQQRYNDHFAFTTTEKTVLTSVALIILTGFALKAQNKEVVFSGFK